MTQPPRVSGARRSRPLPELAVNGGTPVRSPRRRWPEWPVPAPNADRNLREVLGAGRWAISGPQGPELFERRFGRAFAAYTGSRYCVPVDHGSSALVIALESLRLDHGDVVLVPALTWIASASAALRAGLLPLLVDVDPATGCMTAEHLDTDVPARAAVVVHWANVMADVPALVKAAAARDMVVIEDAAQAHGGRWEGRGAGSMGRLGCFSFQDRKVLTGGEGGAVVTDDGALAVALEELRADSRSYRPEPAGPDELELAETAGIHGANFCMSEFNAAVLCAQIEVLEEEHDRRERNFRLLAGLLASIDGVRLLTPAPEQTRLAIYEATFIFDDLPRGVTNQDIATALSAELGRGFYLTDTPLHRSPLLRPWTKPTLKPLADRFADLHRGRRYPVTDHIATHCVQTHHSALLGDATDMNDIAEAIDKVTRAIG
ncbi:DegT/DnrJ/EryC1/StrS family aminotransferase [Actinomadura decatromicini]|uniref:DegT/DnrJ/EryC1/StrS family aminotransferase n=1 Tax=Actinomadura decatromicini TaxID=2604572 RepID=A0A5D3FWI5_9ACTN|nr:DegT/DnrJ/EryC1/StrS family aminotransferase [Actinomadura decatromicini]TYK52398.1 DegT/DnrJ/EryC1/StrS family aminotransferase [Actinomadura decatromicini]